MSTLNQLSNIRNLETAWERILSGANWQYKRYFRDIYNSYDISIERNLKDLRERIKGGSYMPSKPIVIHEPKPSGFIRPISLLTIEDQIVYQAIANLYAHKFLKQRKKIEGHSVFSNILEKPNSIFFFKKWVDSYNDFQIQSQNIFLSGAKWMMEFDLAAFYDCISHDLLIKKLIPNSQNQLKEFLIECFQTWTSDSKKWRRTHGIPQGPIASDFLAEVLLLSIDHALLDEKIQYIRYADDFRFFGFRKYDVMNYLHITDVLCKKHGLIPQNSKVLIKKVKNIDEFLTFNESGDPEEDGEDLEPLSHDDAERIFFESVDEDKGLFLIKSNLKYVLRRSPKNKQIKAFLLKNINKNFQFTHYIFSFFENYIGDSQILGRIQPLIFHRFDFVRAHCWFFLSKSLNQMNNNSIKHHIDLAIKEVKKKSDNNMARLGAMLFLCRSEKAGYGNYANFIRSESSWFNRANLASEIPDRLLSKNKNIEVYFGKNSYEPSVTLGPVLHKKSLTLKSLGINAAQLHTQTKNTYKELGIIKSTSHTKIDPIGEILSKRFNIKKWVKWRTLLGSEYDHALSILKMGNKMYEKNKDKWLVDQNSFNEVLFIQIITTLKNLDIPGYNVQITDQSDRKRSFGTLVNANHNPNDFTDHFPNMAKIFFDINNRRNNLPSSHPYDLRSFARTKPLKISERNQYTQALRQLYKDIILVFDSKF